MTSDFGEASEDYAKFVESMTHLCHCSNRWGRPCDGVLAGGLCDNIQDDNCRDLDLEDED